MKYSLKVSIISSIYSIILSPKSILWIGSYVFIPLDVLKICIFFGSTYTRIYFSFIIPTFFQFNNRHHSISTLFKISQLSSLLFSLYFLYDISLLLIKTEWAFIYFMAHRFFGKMNKIKLKT